MMQGARRYRKTCRRLREKPDTPAVFWHVHLKGGGVRLESPLEPQATHTSDSLEGKLNYG